MKMRTTMLITKMMMMMMTMMMTMMIMMMMMMMTTTTTTMMMIVLNCRRRRDNHNNYKGHDVLMRSSTVASQLDRQQTRPAKSRESRQLFRDISAAHASPSQLSYD